MPRDLRDIRDLRDKREDANTTRASFLSVAKDLKISETVDGRTTREILHSVQDDIFY